MPLPNRNPDTMTDPYPERAIARDVVIPAASVLTLNATPVTLVPAPGANLGLVFEGATIHKPAGTAYAGIAAGEDLSVKYTNAAGAEVGEAETTGFLDQATAQTRYVRPHTAASLISSVTPVANSPLVAHMLAGEITTGDSPLHIRIHYRIVPMFAFAS
jgi:hypothetical protein